MTALVEIHYDRMFAVAFRVLGCREDAEDTVQDVCLSLPHRLARYRGEAGLATWLYRVVVNAALDRLRGEGRHRRASEAWGEIERSRLAEDSERAARRDWLVRAMSGLDPDLRATLALVSLEGMSHEEAAEILDVAPGTIGWRMSEIRRHLRHVAEEETA